jgi:hypothetical protein
VFLSALLRYTSGTPLIESSFHSREVIMFKPTTLVAILVFVACIGQVRAQIAPPVRPVHPVQAPGARPRLEPCWQQAGISKSAIDERNAIGRETREEVEAVCADSALSPQQKQQRIREIRLQAKERTEGLVSPQQQEALIACQKERAGNHPAAPPVHHAPAGPCGEPLATTGPLPAPTSHPAGEKPVVEEDPSPQD